MYFRQKLKANNSKTKKKHKYPCQSQEKYPGPLAPQSDALFLHYLVNGSLLIEIKLFNCTNEMIRNVNKQS